MWKPFNTREYNLQWSKLSYFNWTEVFKGKIPKNLLDFWPQVYNYCDAAGTFHFKDLALAVLNMLILPTSNACVERPTDKMLKKFNSNTMYDTPSSENESAENENFIRFILTL
ncbi:hypothetical protein FF38_13601 [Lucilia cuprina]|uniref:Uncharacterized protein n=1 Tax=Lucilia cuprina TaxID=7375 RepID=A0A0L0CJG3_LUCCU|nr:hypothetical protein FF38_13601 [Lucilia cuprina]